MSVVLVALKPFLETSIEYLKGVGPARAEALRSELQIEVFGDLLTHFPFRYVDRSKMYLIKDIKDENTFIQLRARVIKTKTIGPPRSQRLVVTVEDESGQIDLVWFQGVKWLVDKIANGQEWIIFGKPQMFNGQWNMPHPDIEPPETEPLPISRIIQPIYSSTEKLKSKGLDYKGIGKLVKTLLLHEKFYIQENLNRDLLERLRLIGRQEAFLNIHFPQSPDLLTKAQARLKFEELFFIQLRLLKHRITRLQKNEGHVFSTVGNYLNDFYHKYLTFELTGSQKKVIREIRADMGSGKQMNRLLQGDVGSGKTMVALMCMLIALDNDYQSCLMAPTEILANQHFNNISKMLSGLDVNIRLLTGSTRQSERNETLELLESGKVSFLIGTHALLEDKVKFNNLGLVVIDEQHRFGVAQRAALWEKNLRTPHILVMTATPIPRTLAMTLYGDLDVSVIDELPPGRKPILTKHVYDQDHYKVYSFLKQRIAEGNQVYIVYPLIEESESLDLKNLTEGYQTVVREFPKPEYSIGMVHGKMKQQQKDAEMRRFLNKETQVLVSTTVIEVGVDVKDATIMVIENADRFGLSQLHQLRGRVGRGRTQSYCILMTTGEVGNDARIRIKTMLRTNDGFEIAETDLRLRGPGDLQGTQQSGILNLRVADIIQDEKILKFARNLASEILTGDPGLSLEKNAILAKHLRHMDEHQQNWGLIS
ncbi:MAG: ATP-dependent DNA helicase RecG [Bacteroidetes bacterium]|nr:ATP-dependent DNA helicase RecG [Bacteroidota bacterium]